MLKLETTSGAVELRREVKAAQQWRSRSKPAWATPLPLTELLDDAPSTRLGPVLLRARHRDGSTHAGGNTTQQHVLCVSSIVSKQGLNESDSDSDSDCELRERLDALRSLRPHPHLLVLLGVNTTPELTLGFKMPALGDLHAVMQSGALDKQAMDTKLQVASHLALGIE